MNSTYAMIMAVRNAAEFLEEALESVFAQSHPASELFVVDEFSTDKTVEIVRSFGPKIHLLSNSVGGMTGAYALALPLVKSDFITFLDGDDLWLPAKAEKQIRYLNEEIEVDVVCSAALNFTKDDPRDADFSTSRKFAPSRLFTASTFRRQTFEKFGTPDASAGHFGWLYDWWSKAGDAGIKYALMDEVLLHRRIHGSNSWVQNRAIADKMVIEIARRNIKRRSHD
jgi:glycosyltransferase involved in cell wall biosynthesis